MAHIYTKIARTPEEQSAGLMGKKHLAKNNGMLFDFGRDKELSFWMYNTYIPLNIAFISSSGTIGQIESMVPHSTRSIRSKEKYRYALEVNDGWFDKNSIQVGAQVNFPLPDMQPQGQPQQQQISPELQIAQTHEEILQSLSDYGIKVIIEYETKSGIRLPPKAIEPPFDFGMTAEGDSGGLLTAWDSQRSRYSSFIVDNIITIKDQVGNPITNTQQVMQLYNQTPLTPEEENIAEGKDLLPEETIVNQPEPSGEKSLEALEVEDAA